MSVSWATIQSAEVLENSRKYLFRPEFLPLLDQYLDLIHAGSILDVGSGSGFFTRLLAERSPFAARVVGLEQDKELLQAAISLVEDRGLGDRVHFIAGDAYHLPFGDESFDLVTSHTVMGVLADPLAAIREQIRVTKSGGLVSALESVSGLPYLVNPLPYPHQAELDVLLNAQDQVFRDHVMLLQIKVAVPAYQLALLFEKAGLEQISVSGYLCTFSPSDVRIAPEDGQHWMMVESASHINQVRRGYAAHAELYDLHGFTRDQQQRVLELLADRLRWIEAHPEVVQSSWLMELRPRLIVTGRKPSRRVTMHRERTDTLVL